jgi:pimeloyl-ACP methyl ester carboxylesterase
MIAPRASGAATPGWQRIDLEAGGSYALAYVPESLAPGGPAPAIVFLHGHGPGPEWWQPMLAPLAEEQRFVLVLPKAEKDVSGYPAYGVGDDAAIVDEALRRSGERVAIDSRRVGLAGYSAGGAFALVLAYTTPARFNGVFALGAPYRTVAQLADPRHAPPLRLYYGSLDPNYGNAYPLLEAMFASLGVPQQLDVASGLGHSDLPTAALRDGFAFLLAQPVPPCAPSDTRLCLRGGRFAVEATWSTAAAQGRAGAVRLTDESGYFWFFDRENVELDVKLLDACGPYGRYWVFAAGTTDVEVVLTVTDLVRGQARSYSRPRGTPFAPVLDTAAFATCP